MYMCMEAHLSCPCMAHYLTLVACKVGIGWKLPGLRM